MNENPSIAKLSGEQRKRAQLHFINRFGFMPGPFLIGQSPDDPRLWRIESACHWADFSFLPGVFGRLIHKASSQERHRDEEAVV